MVDIYTYNDLLDIGENEKQRMEFGLYRWDDKATADTVIKENDHAMDDIRYFSNTILKNKIGKTNYTSIFL